MRSALLLAGLGGLALSNAQSPSNSTATPTGKLSPCAAVSSYLSSEASPSVLPAKFAYDCVNSVPVDVDGDVLLIKELKTYLEWNSNTAYMKDPPREYGYVEDPVDIMGGLDLISQGVQNGTYESEYAVQMAIVSLLTKTGDYHIHFYSDIGQVFTFYRGYQLVSVSTDGIALPEVYVWEDFNKTVQNGQNWTPSPIKSINGQDPSIWISEYASTEVSLHDADARYNNIFPNQALLSTAPNDLGLFRTGSAKYVGAYTNVTFANGTKWDTENRAFVVKDFTGVDSGEAFFSKFCTGPPVPEATAQPTAVPSETPIASSTEATVTPTPLNYPEPIVYDEVSLVIGGYYLEGDGFEDVAVLSMPKFESDAGVQAFQNVTRSFLADAKSKGKTKLVVDLRGNGGGYVNAGYEVFKQLFPTVVPYGAGRFRAHGAFHILGDATTLLFANETMAEIFNATNSTLYQETRFLLDDFNYELNLDINNTEFKSFKEFYGPHIVYNDTYTAIRRPNFQYLSESSDLNITGYGSNANVTEQPFEAENIVLLQDGACGSTCTIFSELMREQGNVQTIAIGGRPIEAPMQGIGGTKGSRLFPYVTIVSWARGVLDAFVALDKPTAAKVNETVIGTLGYPEHLGKRIAYNAKNEPLGGVNAADNLRMNDTTETPLQFIYEAADCKLFYTVDQIFDVTKVWKAVVDTKWGNGSCVANSTGDPSSLSGGQANLPYCEKWGNGCPPNSGAARGLTVPAFAVVGVVLAMLL